MREGFWHDRRVESPDTRYALNGDTSLAYQMFGGGDVDVLLVTGPGSHLEVQWEHPLMGRFLSRVGRIGRVVMFDRRGMGLSDPVDRPPTYEQQVEDAVAVLDAVGIERAAVIGISEAGRMAAMFAAARPERVSALVLISPGARPAKDERADLMAKVFGLIERAWGSGGTMRLWGPHLADDADVMAWWGRFERAAASPGMARRYAELALESDTRGVLGAVRAPTLVVHRRGDPVLAEAESAEVAELIPEARFVVMEGRGAYPFMDDPGPLLDEIAGFLTGHATSDTPDTVLATILFTDIVRSTERAQSVGDSAWNELLDIHADAVGRQVQRFGGRQVKDLGDGFMVVFEGPARALRCAKACIGAARSAGLTIRTGVHVGECLRRGDDLGGVSVHVAARIAALAQGGEVLCSSVAKDLAIGSGLRFEDRGEHRLKGVEEAWRLFRLTDTSSS